MKSSSPAKPAPVLKQFAGLWTMVQQPSATKEWSLESKFAHAKAAGFDAIGSGAMPEVVPLCEKYGMEYVCYIDGNLKTYADKLKAAQATNPARINVQLCNHDTPPKDAVKAWVKLAALADKMNLNVDLEIHRDTGTETPEKVAEIAKLYKKETGKTIRFCWDFSHLAVVKHLNPPYADRLLTQPALIQAARQFHFRPFNGHHCQVPVTNGKGRDSLELKAYLEFVDALLALWFKGAKGGEVMYACPELGPIPHGYGLSTFPNVWNDAVVLRAKTEALWKANLKKWRA